MFLPKIPQKGSFLFIHLQWGPIVNEKIGNLIFFILGKSIYFINQPPIGV